MSQQVVIIGCGIVGATIAYELSQIPGLKITVLDRQPPAQASTGAALGVLMGVISQKIKGRAWAMRQSSLQRYATLLPELEAIGLEVPHNRQGILRLCFEGEDRAGWQALQEIRQAQGWRLEIWESDRLQFSCPQVMNSRVTGAIYSPQDTQIDPTALTLALVKASQQNGVTFHFNEEAKDFEFALNGFEQKTCQAVQTQTDRFSTDWVVIAAGLGSTALTQISPQPLEIRPVLGQALRVKLAQPLGDRVFQPVITGEDIHIVPLGNGEYWVGATVEFPTDAGEVVAENDRLQEVWQGAIALCPALAEAKILQTWSGLRPRPHNRPAPIVEPLMGYANILLATGHYRNGVLLAPATAQQIREMILSEK
ncbi:MAG: FAD-binding oxidoreductase [Drouetiella hepatica Uher 2000/2452]|jgi:glycine/D-amino acid oxidase-like deaminating enzyme|uniref:FAD-binding oxidoreductase n=1 Tax=Drouetiella hepatica Uher 2000/2452 TaxID=904376 RepID=A0A951QF64_9CYAN|nr:FAD-binding oxidoreductase [Drouetiella hepatica Uher 2000/2452]